MLNIFNLCLCSNALPALVLGVFWRWVRFELIRGFCPVLIQFTTFVSRSFSFSSECKNMFGISICRDLIDFRMREISGRNLISMKSCKFSK